MKRKRYSTLVKSILFVIQSILAVSLAVFVVLLQSCVNQNMLNLGDLSNSSFVDSGYFEKITDQQTQNVLEYLELKQKLETDGRYDEAKAASEGVREEDINLYKKYYNQYETGSSNLYYWLGSQSSGCLYTNMDLIPALEKSGESRKQQLQQINVDKAWEEAQALGEYLYFDSSAFYFDSNIGGIEKSYYQNMRTYNDLTEGDHVLIIGVDTTFAAVDDFSVAQKEFSKLYPWAKMSMIFIVVSGVGWLFTLCYLTVTAGCREEDMEIHTFSFDKIKTEVCGAMLVIAEAGVAELGIRVSHQQYETSGRMIVYGTLAFLASVVFMCFYLSFVRRIKADNFWNNSLIHWCVQGIKEFTEERYLSWKKLFGYWALAVFCIFLGYMALGKGQIWAYVVIAAIIVCAFVYFYRWEANRSKVLDGISRITDGDLDYKLDLNEFSGGEKVLAEGINHIAEGLANAINESVQDERMKANMITNVSHDLKTPLTSIINYVGLLKREDIQNENAKNYIEVLDQKAMRLKSLMEDLVEVSKISSGNISLQMDEIDLVELVRQTGGEFNERLEEKGLTVISKFPNEPRMIYADGRQTWRIIGNLYSNVAKYALPETRVYVELAKEDNWIVFSMKNISRARVSVPATDLTERFVRGDEARSTEGSGLGLSIAKTLTELMNGRFTVSMDADLFCVEVRFLLLQK